MAKIKTLDIQPRNKVVIVTGGYGHLGKAITASLLYNGAKVIVAARNREKFDDVFRSELQTFKNHLFFVHCDINSSESINRAIKDIYNQFGKIDGLINNAFGVFGFKPINISRKEFNMTLDSCLTAAFEMIKSIVPYMVKGGGIVNVTSMYGMVAPDFRAYENGKEFTSPPHYGAAKAGLIQLSKYYASYLGEEGIRINSVSPGPFPSDEIQKNRSFMEQLNSRTVLGRFGRREDLAGIFSFLMSDAASYITGQNFVVDGGWTVR